MFEQEIGQLIASVQERTIMKSHAVVMKDLMAADIPYALKKYLRTSIEVTLDHELNVNRNVSRFNWDHPEVRSLHGQINSILVLNYQFERNEFLALIDDAVHLLVNFLVRPQWTLKNFLFERESALSAAAIIQNLKYFSPHQYLLDLTLHYLRERKPSSLTADAFAAIVWKLDSEYVRRRSGEQFAGLAAPLFEFFDYPDHTTNNTLPAKALAKFCEDKGLKVVADRIEEARKTGAGDLSFSAWSELITEFRRTEGEFRPERVLEITFAAPAPAEAPLSAAEPPPKPPAIPMLSLFSDSDRKRIVKKVFLQDETAFFDALNSIDAMTSWKQASAFVDEILITNNIDPYSNDAKRLMEILYQRYFPKRD